MVVWCSATRPANPAIESNSFNAELRQRLFESGIAVIGHTVVRGRQCLKLTCMNPSVSARQVEELLGAVIEYAKGLEGAPKGHVDGS